MAVICQAFGWHLLERAGHCLKKDEILRCEQTLMKMDGNGPEIAEKCSKFKEIVEDNNDKDNGNYNDDCDGDDDDKE